jgi:hydroxymethylpyrimidine/phosphomethylpyrimidine kinase
MHPTALTIAGSDSSGGAGVQADLKSFHIAGVQGATAITAITAQNTQGVDSIFPLPIQVIEQQIVAVVNDYQELAAKTGMLYSPEIARHVADLMEGFPLVVDPVMESTTRHTLAKNDLVDAIVENLVPIASIITPNLDEAIILSGMEIKTMEDLREACCVLYDMGAANILITGSHHTESVTDILYDGHKFHSFTLPLFHRDAHGSGCTLSAFLAAFLSRRLDVKKAVARAKQFSWTAIFNAKSPGLGVGVVWQSKHPLPVLNQEKTTVWYTLQTAINNLLGFLPSFLVPEVGINLAFALPNATAYSDICAIAGRIISKDGPVQVGECRFGASRHIASIVLAAMQHNPAKRAAMNIAYSKQILHACRLAGFTIGTFDRSNEPSGVSTMEWGTNQAINIFGQVPDIVWDSGGEGKEAMIRVIGEKPDSVVDNIYRIVQSIHAMEKN